VNEIISSYIKAKVPHFFIHAKDKDVKNVEGLNGSTVNKLETIIPNKRISFVKVAGKFDYKILMKNYNVELNEKIIDLYTYLDRNKKWLMKKNESTKTNHKFYVYEQIRKDILEINIDIEYVVDVLIKYLYCEKNSKFKETLWWTFGDVLLDHIINNLNISEVCCDCGSRFIQTKQRQVRCDSCKKERDRVNARLRKRKQRVSNNDKTQRDIN
jgi:hypothetical protein